MERFLAYCYIAAIVLLFYAVFYLFYTLEQQKAECVEVWMDDTCMNLGVDFQSRIGYDVAKALHT